MDGLTNLLIATNSQKVLFYMLDYPGQEFTEKEIQTKVNISKSGTNYALRELIKANYLFLQKKRNDAFLYFKS
ncbi:MAG: helix-turn-helix domain-containing protein [Pseudomonadota bacterium]